MLKKMSLAIFLLSILVVAMPVYAEQATDKPETAVMDMGKMDAIANQMREMRHEIEKEKDPATRKEILYQHQQMMHEGMGMMNMMMGRGGGHMMMGGSSGRCSNEWAAMMESRMGMMQEMLNGMMMRESMMK